MKDSPTKKMDRVRKSAKEKKRQSTLTNRWLEDNYAACDGVCIPRCILYSQYLEFCQSQKLFPACSATFGKIIRQKFPNITTRRLGTRGHSKYHYYGICVKETSQYYQTKYPTTGLTRFSGCKSLNEGGFTKKYSLASKTGTLIPEFPSSREFHLPMEVDASKLDTLLMMFRTHCQCVVDTMISGHFSEIPTYLYFYWQGIPEHLHYLLESQLVIDLLCYCDTILYDSLVDVLIPHTMQEVPEQLLMEIQTLAKNWEESTNQSMAGLPETLARSRLSIAQRFAQTLRRQAAFLHLTQRIRPVLYDTSQSNMIISDVSNLAPSAGMTSLQITGLKDQNKPLHILFLDQFKDVLQKHATIEAITEWLDSIIDQHILRVCYDNHSLFNKKAHEFLLIWSQFGCHLMGKLSEQGSHCQISINLIRLLMDEYVMLAIETQLHDISHNALLSSIKIYAAHDTAGAGSEDRSDDFYSFPTLKQAYANSNNAPVPSQYTVLTPPLSPDQRHNSCRYAAAMTTSSDIAGHPQPPAAYGEHSSYQPAPTGYMHNYGFQSGFHNIIPPQQWEANQMMSCTQHTTAQSNQVTYDHSNNQQSYVNNSDTLPSINYMLI